MPLSNPSVYKRATSIATTSSTVASATASTVLLAANSNRLGATFWNNSNSDLYLDLDSTSSTSNFAVKVSSGGGYYELPFGYAGVVSGIWDIADGSALVREFV